MTISTGMGVMSEQWKLVPVAPHWEMEVAARECNWPAADIYGEIDALDKDAAAKQIYAAMLAASPQPPVEPSEEEIARIIARQFNFDYHRGDVRLAARAVLSTLPRPNEAASGWQPTDADYEQARSAAWEAFKSHKGDSFGALKDALQHFVGVLGLRAISAWTKGGANHSLRKFGDETKAGGVK